GIATTWRTPTSGGIWKRSTGGWVLRRRRLSRRWSCSKKGTTYEHDSERLRGFEIRGAGKALCPNQGQPGVLRQAPQKGISGRNQTPQRKARGGRHEVIFAREIFPP